MLWDVTLPKYSNADERKEALSRNDYGSHEMDDLDTHATHVQFLIEAVYNDITH